MERKNLHNSRWRKIKKWKKMQKVWGNSVKYFLHWKLKTSVFIIWLSSASFWLMEIWSNRLRIYKEISRSLTWLLLPLKRILLITQYPLPGTLNYFSQIQPLSSISPHTEFFTMNFRVNSKRNAWSYKQILKKSTLYIRLVILRESFKFDKILWRSWSSKKWMF